MKRVIILQARMASTRLPGKVLKPILGKPMLAYELERLQRVRHQDALVVATSIKAVDDPVEALCRQLNVSCYRGSETDVLSRYYEAACWRQADVVVRVTGDCPIIDPVVIDAVIAMYQQGGFDYVSNTLERTFPRGLDVEVFSFAALTQAYRQAEDPVEREHVTPYLYRHPERFRLGQHQQHENHGAHRWTVDTPEDFALVEQIVKALYPTHPGFGQADVLRLLQAHPEWVALNAHVEQVKVHQP